MPYTTDDIRRRHDYYAGPNTVQMERLRPVHQNLRCHRQLQEMDLRPRLRSGSVLSRPGHYATPTVSADQSILAVLGRGRVLPLLVDSSHPGDSQQSHRLWTCCVGDGHDQGHPTANRFNVEAQSSFWAW
jgi:hypothetical protein